MRLSHTLQRLRAAEAGRDIQSEPTALAAESKVEYETGKLRRKTS